MTERRPFRSAVYAGRRVTGDAFLDDALDQLEAEHPELVCSDLRTEQEMFDTMVAYQEFNSYDGWLP